MPRNKKPMHDENIITMTQDAHDLLVKELDHKKNVLRKELAEEIAKARELGDLSENHAYTVAMEKKEMNENRINEIDGIIAVVNIVQDSAPNNFVNVGELVEIQNLENSSKRIVVLVGSQETKSANPSEGKISTDSPIGKAIYNSKIGDTVKVILPTKIVEYKIIKFVKNK